MTGSTGTFAPRLHGAVAVRVYITGIMCTATLVLPHCLNHGVQTQTSSMDRPEYWMLTPITSRPLQTSLCALAGSIISSLLWSRHLQSESGRKTYSASTFLNLGVALALCSAAAHIVLLALGAPLDELRAHTLVLACHLCTLAVLPILCGMVSDSGSISTPSDSRRYRLIDMICNLQYYSAVERGLVWPMIGALLGTWLGTVPIALDWDRPWQSFPLTLIFGSSIGYLVSIWSSLLA